MTNYTTNHLTIKAWAEEDRPREKLLLKGKKNLSDAELLAIIIGSGSRDETALGLSQRILAQFDSNLNEVGRQTPNALMKFKGIGEAKAIAISAALELGHRRQLSSIKDRPKITSSRDAFNAIAPLVVDLPHEEFWILLLNRSNLVVGRERISTGGVAGTVVDAKLIFKKALQALVPAIILCHNHPSGNLRPSQADIDITKKLRKGGESIDVTVLDHLIVSEMGYYSFADEGML